MRSCSPATAPRAIEALRLHEPAVVTLDLGLPPDPDGTTEGFETLTQILRLKPDTKVIVASGHGARESMLKAIGLGAYDFYRKPVDIDELGLIVARAFHVADIEAENRRLEQAGGGQVLGSIISSAPEMLKVAKTIERVATADVSVMLLGASGTGKELLARAVHEKSGRKGEFIAINCAAIPETLLEAELFGYERGAFTGAVKSNVGKIEMAEGGTLFLDEVGDIPLPLQVKLLRFLQERVIERIGGRQPIAVDTRIVCATHQDLDAMTADGRFREDLYYRLAEIVVKIPSLAERPGDAVLLARHFVNRFGKELNTKVQSLSADAVAAIDAYGWPGNVRELENRIKRAVIMADGKIGQRGRSRPSGQRQRRGGSRTGDQPARRPRERRPQGDPPGAQPHRQQYLGRGQAARDQPADALRPDQAVSAECVRPAIEARLERRTCPHFRAIPDPRPNNCPKNVFFIRSAVPGFGASRAILGRCDRPALAIVEHDPIAVGSRFARRLDDAAKRRGPLLLLQHQAAARHGLLQRKDRLVEALQSSLVGADRLARQHGLHARLHIVLRGGNRRHDNQDHPCNQANALRH